MRRLAVALFTASLGLGSASAADLPVDVYGSPAYAPTFVAPVRVVYNWTGLYLGAHGGAPGVIRDGFSSRLARLEFNSPAQIYRELTSAGPTAAVSSVTIISCVAVRGLSAGRR